MEVDEPDRRRGCPAFQAAYQTQFEELTITVDCHPAIASAGFASNLGLWIGSLPEGYAVTESDHPRSLAKHPGLLA